MSKLLKCLNIVITIKKVIFTRIYEYLKFATTKEPAKNFGR